ncbi:head fiber protein [Streptomyces sp. STCH 565 A]|uniref:head fiber protein n=1 Tax=Streptomyces sp. STCH 565 A TaxID=2950532 RepID=UPI0020764650|nr:head fiber protein [Streptomyces sp. STCH 565 A]MCM8555347.1 head fiber protein [Streptomyces sp. STCH 565 A]
MIRGRTTDEGAVEFYDNATDEVVFTIDADGAAGGSTAWDDVTGKPATFPPTIGATASTAAAGNHTHTGLLSGAASAVNDSTATDAAGLVEDFNALLVALRSRGVISGA